MPSNHAQEGGRTPGSRSSPSKSTQDNLARRDPPVFSSDYMRDGVAGQTCTQCFEWKPLTKFGPYRKGEPARRTSCYSCVDRLYLSKPANLAKSIAKVRAWAAANPERHRASRTTSERTRHGKPLVGRGVTAAEYRAVKAQFGGLCVYCTEPADTTDHVIPLSRGGKHEFENLVPACKRCNFQKHSKMPAEWLVIREK